MDTKQTLTPLEAMKALIASLPEGRERAQAVETLMQLSWRLWGWNVEQFQAELRLGDAR